MLYKLFLIIHRMFPAKEVLAHCDVPCGIYTVEPAQTAARTVMRMVELIEQLETATTKEAQIKNQNAMARYILVKEQYAQIAKDQLLILWTDYFKEGHLEMFPDLHEKIWNAAKLCSKNKQQVSMDLARQLQEAVNEIAQIFLKVEAVKFKV